MARYTRIWAGDDGESHLDDVEVPATVSPAEPGVAELVVSAAVPVDRLHLVTVRAATQRPDWHRAPRRQFVVFLTGWVRITASDGTSRHLDAPAVVLAEDTHGRGHVTEHAPGDQQVLIVPLDPEPGPAAGTAGPGEA